MARSAVSNRKINKNYAYSVKNSSGGTSRVRTTAGVFSAFGTGSVTLEARIKMPGIPTPAPGLFGLDDNTATGHFLILMNGVTANIIYKTGVGTTTTKTVTMPASFFSEWGTLHMILDSSLGKLIVYWNGVSILNTAATWNLLGTCELSLGEVAGVVTGLQNVRYGQFKVWSRTLSATEVVSRHFQDDNSSSMRTNLQLEWLMTEGSGTSVVDTSGNSRTGTMTSFAWDSTDTPGKARTAIITQQNLLTYSEQFDHANWTKGTTTVTANADTAPNGSMTADRLYEVGGGAVTHYIVQSALSKRASNLHTSSVYLKAGTRSWAILSPDGGVKKVYYNLATGVIGTHDAGLTGYGIESAGNGWYRCWASFLASSSNQSQTAFWVTTGDGAAGYVGDPSMYISCWGGQEVVANWYGPYVQTVAAAVDTENIRNKVSGRVTP